MDIFIPERYRILIALSPYFDDQENLLKMDDEELVTAYSEMKFFETYPLSAQDIED